jgi:D-alanyl-D-alanine carboxypeptidase
MSRTFRPSPALRVALPVLALVGMVCASHAQATAAPGTSIDPSQARDIDTVAQEWLARTEAPSASIAVVEGGKLVYAQAYGNARLNPAIPAIPSMRYAIDSVSKEFTAAAVLMLAQEKKLSLSDPVGKWFPQLGAASKATLRQILTHTAGIRDYWPQDYVPAEMLRPTTTAAIIDEWARRPTDFAPGTDWQYSNTGYVLAGAIVEKVSGEPLLQFLQRRVFSPLGMSHVTEDDSAPLSPGDPGAYTRNGLGPVQPAPKEGPGWLFGAAALAMTPGDLALWDISLIDRSLLTARSYDAEFEPIVLRNGKKRDYALGLDVETIHGRLRIGHDGAGSGFLAVNRIWPTEKAAVIVLTNNDWAGPEKLLNRIAFVILPPTPEVARARELFNQFQRGEIDRSLLTANANQFFDAAVLSQMQTGLGPLGPARYIGLERESRRGGMITRRWKIECRAKTLEAVERSYPDGKVEQFTVSEAYD